MSNLVNKLPGDLDFVDMTCNHQCSCCGSCCTSQLPLTKKEISRLKEYILENKIEPSYLSTFDKHNLYGFCPLLDPVTKKCKAYEARPFVCRDFKCDKSKDTIKRKREMYARRADYNGIPGSNAPIASTQLLLFGDVAYDIQWRHLTLQIILNQDPDLASRFGELTLEKEQAILPMLVDSILLKKGGNL